MNTDRRTRQLQAENNVEKCSKLYKDAIDLAIDGTIIYKNRPKNIRHIKENKQRIIFTPTDTVSGLFEVLTSIPKDEKVAILNFASHRNPGGGYLGGSLAQEEALCSESFLYNVLSSDKCVKEFYEPHETEQNDGVYTDDCIYTPNVTFFKEGREANADVITIAAPNWYKYTKEKDDFLAEKLTNAQQTRVRTILEVAIDNNVDNLVLGAFGCGVFRNKPKSMAQVFKYYLSNEFNKDFNIVMFAIPRSNKDNNYSIFKQILV